MTKWRYSASNFKPLVDSNVLATAVTAKVVHAPYATIRDKAETEDHEEIYRSIKEEAVGEPVKV